ncbi:MAG: M23 family metallopeptidase [Acidobacteria bacterium]|nr:M23 family metallopeptidase [Acidobacteriota bacterium]
MKQQQYFIVVLAHSLHGRLRRIHVPQQFLYAVLGLALIGCFSLFGFVSSYVRMAWKVANYNSLRDEFDSLRERYQNLEKDSAQTKEQLANLQMLASEVSVAYGIKRKLEGPSDIASEGRLIPTVGQSLEEYDFLRSANFSVMYRKYPKLWQTNTRPAIWPVNGRLQSWFGRRTDPFSGDEGVFHRGVDIVAPAGTPVRAAADGVVVHAGFLGGYGRLVVIDHGNGLQTYYAHLSRSVVIPGQEIRRGEVLGAVGATGRATAPHLHYEVRQHGNPVNPTTYLKTAVAQTATPAKRDLPF